MWMCMVPQGFLHSMMAEIITNDTSPSLSRQFITKLTCLADFQWCLLIFSQRTYCWWRACICLTLGSQPHDMPALVLFHRFLNSISGSPGLWDCLVIIRRRLFLSGIHCAMAVIQWDVRRAIVLGPGEETAPTFKTVPKGEGRDEPLKMDGQHRRFF